MSTPARNGPRVVCSFVTCSLPSAHQRHQRDSIPGYDVKQAATTPPRRSRQYSAAAHSNTALVDKHGAAQNSSHLPGSPTLNKVECYTAGIHLSPVVSCRLLAEGAMSTPPPFHTTGHLVGRAREQTALHDALAAALAGHGGLVLISGEAGIGKTALAEALGWEAEGQGALVLVGRCYDLTETPPYGPWRELFARAPSVDLPPCRRQCCQTVRAAIGWRARASSSRACRRISPRWPPPSRSCCCWTTCTGPTLLRSTCCVPSRATSLRGPLLAPGHLPGRGGAPPPPALRAPAHPRARGPRRAARPAPAGRCRPARARPRPLRPAGRGGGPAGRLSRHARRRQPLLRRRVAADP